MKRHGPCLSDKKSVFLEAFIQFFHPFSPVMVAINLHFTKSPLSLIFFPPELFPIFECFALTVFDPFQNCFENPNSNCQFRPFLFKSVGFSCFVSYKINEQQYCFWELTFLGAII